MDSPTHSPRRGRQSLSYSSTPLYKVIMIFNTLMNISASIIAYLGAPPPARISVYSYFLIAYFLVAIPVVVGKIIYTITNKSDQRKTCTKCVDAVLHLVFTDLSLIIAGELYLAGDNILIIHRSFDATVPIIRDITLKAGDLRSYIVAFSLAFMIIAQIGPFVASRISEYIEPLREMTLVVEFDSCESAQTNGTGFWEKMRQATLYIPPGHHTLPDWKTGKTLIFRHEQLSAICDGEQQYSKIHLTSKIHLPDSSFYNVAVDLSFFKKFKDFVHMSEIRVKIPSDSVKIQNTSTHSPCTPTQHRGVTIFGKSPKLTFKTNKSEKTYAWSAEFQIPLNDKSDVESQKNLFQVNYESKIASHHLTQACFSLLDYALIADALYTTMLDEITQQDDVKTGKNCPSAHIIVAIVLLGIIIIAWSIVVTLILPFGFCGRCKYFDIFLKPTVIEKIKNNIIGTIEDNLLEIDSLLSKLKDILSDKSICFKGCAVVTGGLTIVTAGVLLFVLSPLILVGILFIILLIVVIAVIAVIPTLIVIVIIFFIRCCCRSNCCQKLDIYEIITPVSVLIMTIYLPIYLIADNSWPWICWVDRGMWKLAGSLPLNAIVTLINMVSISYVVLTFVMPPDQQGQQNGQNEGQQNGQNEGQQNGQNEGQQNGQNEGQQNGQNEGQQNGQNEGQQNGQNEGQQNGQNEGQQNGQNEGQQNGQNGGQQNGQNEGQQNGQNEGQQNGQNEGQQNGQNEGQQINGQNEGRQNGQNEGRQNGQNEGRQNGQNEGQQNGQNEKNEENGRTHVVGVQPDQLTEINSIVTTPL